jgi:hypothetical protein
MLLPMLLLLVQAMPDSDEAAAPSRLNVKPDCRRPHADIMVCGDPQQVRAERYRRRLEAQPDPMFADKRPRIHIAKGWCLRVGFMVNAERC